MNAILEQINSAGLKFVEFALPMFVQSVVLIVILLLADFALRKKVRAVFRYWIWLLVLVKLVLPTSLSSPMSLGYFFGDRLTYVDTTETPAEPQTSLVERVPASVPPFIDLTDIEADRFTPAAPPLMPVTEQLKEPVVTSPAAPQTISITPLSWKGAVFLTWLIVVIAMVLLLLQRAVFVRALVAQAKEANGVMADMLESCRSSMSVKRKLGLKISANATSPAVCGLFRPVILIPQNLASNLAAGQLRAVLLHELAHIRRGDLFVNLAQTVLQIVYFYNPMLWLANAITRRVREQAVDEMVLVAMGEKAPQYPQTLVSVAKLAFKRPVLSLRLIGVVESKSALAGRIKHILNRPLPKKAKLGILSLVVVIFTAAILLPMAACKPGPPSLVIKGKVKDAQTGEPIAGARVFDDGYAHEPVWEQIRPDQRYEWGAITNSAGEYSFLTWPEHHTIKVEAPGYKSQRRNLYNGHFTFNKKDQETFDFTLEPEKASDSSEFKKTLPNGVTVELVGICEDPTIKGQQWWRPNGKEIKEPEYELRGKQGFKYPAFGYLLKFSPFEELSYRSQINFDHLFFSSGPVTRKGQSVVFWGENDRQTKPLPAQSDITVDVASGEWKENKPGRYSVYPEFTNLADKKVIILSGLRPNPEEGMVVKTLIEATTTSIDVDIQLECITKSGKSHKSWSEGSLIQEGQLIQHTFGFAVPMEDIDKIHVKHRKFYQVEFKNVSLKPNFKSDLQVEGDEAWGEVVEGLRVRWVHPNEPIVRGTAPVLTMEVENVSSKQIIWECSSGFTWGLNVHGVSPANSLTMPKFRVQVGSDASPEYPGGKTGPEPQPTDYYKLEPEGRIRLSCALPWVLPDSGQYTVKGVIWRRKSKTESLEMGCSSLVLNVVNPTSASDKLAYWGAADTLTGLQLGLSFDLQARPYRQGEVISFKTHVRNTGDKIVKLVYFGLLGWGPTIYDSNGEIVSVRTPILGFPVQKQSLSLNPGEIQSVGTVFLELQPGPNTRWDDKSVYPRCYLTPGTYRISQKYRFADDPEAIWHGELTTGELELTILRKPPDMQVEGKKNKPPVWLALLPRSPIRSAKELYLYFWGSSLLSDRTKIDSFELEIRSAGDNVRMARIDSKSMITVHSSKGEVLRWSMFRDGLRENMIRRIGPLEDGEYLIAIYVNGIRSSNVAKFTVDSSFDGSNEPTLQVVPLVPAPGKKLQYFGLRATGPAPQDSELTNMALHFADIIVDGVPRKILARSWSGPVYPLKPGQQHEEILLLNYYKPEIDLSRKHTVKAIVGRYESAPVEIGFDRSLELAWDDATPTITSRPPRPAVLEGRVIGPDGKPGIGYRVCLYADPGRNQFIEYSDEDGKYDFPNVPTGSYKLTCRPGGNSEPALTFEQFQIEAGKTIVQELSLEGKYAFSGKVTYEDGSPAAGVKIVGRWEIGAGKVFRDLRVTDENGYYELTAPFELARYISLSIFTPDGIPAQGSYEHIGVRGSRTDVDFVVKRREIHAAIWPEKFARMGGKHPDFQPVPVPEGWDNLRLLQSLYEHLETQFKTRFPDCRATLKDEVIELSFNTRDYNIIRPGNATRTGMQRGNDRGIGPEPDGLVLTVHFSTTAGRFDRPYIIDRSPWTGFISQVYLPDVKLYLNVDVQYGTGINEKLLTDLCAPTGWLKTIFNNFNERTPERKATAGAVEKGPKPNVQVVSEIDWVIEDYGQTRLLSGKEKPDTDNWVSIWGNVVKNKGRYLVPERGLTLKGLIKAAGYNRDKLAQSYVELIRRSQEANITMRSTYSRNLKTLLSGEESDVVIKPHDSIGCGYIEPSANGVEFWSGYHFGEVVEMTVNDDGAKINMFADLDTGKLVTSPDTLDVDDENAVLRWIKENGIDVMGETASSVHGLIGFNMYAAHVDNYFWDAAPQEVTDRLMVRIDDPVLLSVENLLPVTYLIKTSKYKMGILQILGFTENPKGIKICYKLLNKEAAPKPVVRIEAEPVSTDWQYIGQSIPPDFNDIMVLAEHVNLGSIGHDAEGKTFITLLRDRQKTKGRQYRFVLFNKAGNILEPDGYVVLDGGERLEEKFTFDEPFICRQLKGFRFQARPLPLSGIDNISSHLQKSAHVFDFETIIPSDLAPPGRYAVELDGVDDYLLVSDSPSLRLEPPFTIEMWIKTKLPPDASEYRGGWAVISKGFTVGTPRAYLTGFGINLQRFPKEPSNLHIDFCRANNSGTYSSTYAGYPLTNGISEWLHIHHVFDGEYYKSAPGHPLVMGKFLIPTNDPFKGLLGEVRLWNGARTRQELRQYKSVALTGTEPGLAACWTFEQTEGQFAYDISGNNNHARLGKFTGPDGADPKWIDLQAPSPQPDTKSGLQVDDIRIKSDSSAEAVDSDEISGRVVDETGDPIADAQVALSTEKIGVKISDGKLLPMGRNNIGSKIVLTDSQGWFNFGRKPSDTFDLVVAHERGFVQIDSENINPSYDIQIQSWGRIKGQLAQGRRAVGDEIGLRSLPNPTWLINRQECHYETKCDSTGRFTFDNVPPGWFEVGYLVPVGDASYSFTCRTPVEVKSGQTVKVMLGGSGRPVVGKFIPPQGYNKPIYFGQSMGSLSTVRPERPRPDNYHKMTKRQQQQWYKQWRKTDEYIKYRDAVWHNKNWRQYAFHINENGSFRVEDVIAGEYQFMASIEERITSRGRPDEMAAYYGTIEVQDIPGGRSDEPLDLGELELTMYNPLRVGDVAPLFEAETLYGENLRLIDYRDRFVLLSFWQPVSHPELRQLKDLYDIYRSKGWLEIIGLGGADTLDEVKNYVRENAISWPQIYTGEEFKSGIAKDYGGFGIFLIGPDGRIVAKNLHGEKLRSTVSEILNAANRNKHDRKTDAHHLKPTKQTETKAVDKWIPLKVDYPEPSSNWYDTYHRIAAKSRGKKLAEKPPLVLVPPDVTNVAKGKPVTSTDAMFILGELEYITDGDKRPRYYVEYEPQELPQHVTIDLERDYEIYAVVWWHCYDRAAVYWDVVVQVGKDPKFEDAVILFNNDHDGSLGLGKGTDLNYIETNEGWMAGADGVVGRYVRLYNHTNTNNMINQYTEVEVYGRLKSPRLDNIDFGLRQTERMLRTDVKRQYPVQLIWPLVQDASKYVIRIHGLRGSQPAKSFESVTNRLRLNESDIPPGRYQWSVSVYDEQGKLISDIETIEPDEIFAIEDPQPVAKNGKTAMIDLNHSAGHMRGWGYYNHAQYMTKELLENAGFEVQVNDRDLLIDSSLKSVDLLICNYYWTGWPEFRPYLNSELDAIRQFVEGGGSLLVVGCDGKDGGGNMCKAGNELISQFGLTFEQGKISKGSGMAKTESRRDIMSFDKSFLIQLPVSVLGDDALTFLRFEAEPIVKARRFGQGRVIAAGVGMSFLDCYLADFQNREPLYMIMFYDFVRYLTRIDWKQSCKQDFIEKVLSRCQF